MMQHESKHRLVYGAGPEWTELLEDELADRVIDFPCFELIPENFFNNNRKYFLDKLNKANIPVLIHAVGLSLGTDEPLKNDHLDKILAVADQVNMINFSEHLSMTEAAGIEIGQLTPIPWSIKSADVVIRKIEAIQQRINVPFALEHVAYKFFYPKTELSESEFINRILDRTGCDLMLDLNNLFCNSSNTGYDPYVWLEQVKIDRVSSIHLAGGYLDKYGIFQDGHSAPIPEAVWKLLEHVLQKITPQAIIVERTDNYPGIENLLSEVNKAHELLLASINQKSFAKKPTSSELLVVAA
jgi:uncharacterized protein